MKKYLFIIALSGLSFLTASAQDDQKLRNDHTYSTHNYKHPNKAAAARQWENKPGVEVRAPGRARFYQRSNGQLQTSGTGCLTSGWRGGDAPTADGRIAAELQDSAR